MQLLSRLIDPIAILTVDHKYQALRSRIVVPPKRTDLVLPSHVPYVELDVFVLYRLDVEADRGDRGDGLIQFELVQDRSFARGVESEHEDAHFFVAKDLAHGSRQAGTHLGEFGRGADPVVRKENSGSNTHRHNVVAYAQQACADDVRC